MLLHLYWCKAHRDEIIKNCHTLTLPTVTFINFARLFFHRFSDYFLKLFFLLIRFLQRQSGRENDTKCRAIFFASSQWTRVQLDSNQNKNWAKNGNLSLEFSDSHEKGACVCLFIIFIDVFVNEKSMSDVFVYTFQMPLHSRELQCNAFFTRLRHEKFRKFVSSFYFYVFFWMRNAFFCLIFSFFYFHSLELFSSIFQVLVTFDKNLNILS